DELVPVSAGSGHRVVVSARVLMGRGLPTHLRPLCTPYRRGASDPLSPTDGAKVTRGPLPESRHRRIAAVPGRRAAAARPCTPRRRAGPRPTPAGRSACAWRTDLGRRLDLSVVSGPVPPCGTATFDGPRPYCIKSRGGLVWGTTQWAVERHAIPDVIYITTIVRCWRRTREPRSGARTHRRDRAGRRRHRRHPAGLARWLPGRRTRLRQSRRAWRRSP